MAAKRSPILGYNHNVRYRGLIFHVQTEDSGLLSPHLFTHLFHGGVILSSRKLVYDAGAAEDAIKGLMQAQHKVVLKDLKSGKFDAKIDSYLGNVEGLLPTENVPAEAEAEAEAEPEDLGGELEAAPPGLAHGLDLPRASEPAMQVRMSEPEISILESSGALELDLDPDPPEPEAAAEAPEPEPPKPRTQTQDRGSAPSKVRTSLPPPPMDLDPATELDDVGQIAAAIAAANAAANATVKTTLPPDMEASSLDALKLELEPLDADAHDVPVLSRRRTRDTEVSSSSDGVPSAIGASASGRAGGDSIPPLPPPPDRRTGDRSALGAATLPPARPVTRPGSGRQAAMSAPAVVSRPLSTEDSDAVEVYAAAPPSADAPPGAASERPGQYAQHKRVSQRGSAVEMLKPERERAVTGSIPIPSGLGRPSRSSQSPGSSGVPQRVQREPSSSNPARMPATPPPLPPRAATPSAPPRTPTPSSRPVPAASDSARLDGRPPERSRRLTPARVSGSGAAASSGSGGVVMTRPAVIVGAPSKPTHPKVRKAREDESRGFGQGLISEKSLDEVILAYLSEDSEDK